MFSVVKNAGGQHFLSDLSRGDMVIAAGDYRLQLIEIGALPRGRLIALSRFAGYAGTGIHFQPRLPPLAIVMEDIGVAKGSRYYILVQVKFFILKRGQVLNWLIALSARQISQFKT